MRTTLTLLGLGVSTLCFGSTGAEAQIFSSYRPALGDRGPAARAPRPPAPLPEVPPTPPVPGEGKEPAPEAEAKEVARPGKLQRFQLGLYRSKWSSADSIISPAPDLTTIAHAGFLASAEVFISRQWSVGGYWNHFSGTTNELPPGSPTREQTAKDTIDVMEGHVAYYLGPKLGNLSLQAGAGGSRDISKSVVPGVPQETFHALNISFWLNSAGRIGSIKKRQVDLFGGLGMRTSELVGQSVDFRPQLLVGTAIHLNRHLQASASVWTANIDQDPETRFNAGLSTSL